MKQITLFILFLFLGVTSSMAQDEILDEIASQGCDCVEKLDLTGLSQDEKNMKFGFCLMEKLGNLDQAQMNALGIDMTDQASLQKFGEKVGFRMATKCPNVMMKIAQVQSDTQIKSVSEASGTVKGITGSELSYVQIDDGTGDLNSFLWLKKVDGADAFLSNPQAMVGKKVKITFETMDIYSSKTKGYNSKKVITAIEVIQ
jgi:hypothetical protein